MNIDGARGDARAREGSRLLDAVELMDRLCTDGEWESRQTHASLVRYLIEETYELVDAIDAGGRDELVAELGDVLLQVLFHARIGAGFTIDDVAESFIRKVSARSAGVLAGGVDLQTQVDDWERAKSAERPGGSCMDGIATGQPALALAEKILERARGAGVPDDAVPAALAAVALRPGGGAEQRLRAEALGFALRIREAEDALRARHGDTGGFTAAQWRAALG